MTDRYLVTGCAGFIGSQVTEQLLAAGHWVVGVDNLNDAYDRRLKRWRLARFADHPALQFHQQDIADRDAMQSRFDRDAADDHGQASGRPYTAILNLAARAGVRPSVEDPWIYIDANATGTLNLLEMARRHHVGKFVLSSTSSLYGSHNPIPYSEDADTNRPLSPYAASKKAAEAMCYTYHHLHALDVTVLRYFTVYGPAGRPDMSVLRFVRRIAEGESIVVFGDGQQQRDFTFIDDIARGTIAALRPVGYEVVNLGGDRPVKLCDIIDTIARLLGKPVQIDHYPAHPADVPATWANISKARELLGWTPEVAVEEGLRRTVEWYKANRDEMIDIRLGDR